MALSDAHAAAALCRSVPPGGDSPGIQAASGLTRLAPHDVAHPGDCDDEAAESAWEGNLMRCACALHGKEGQREALKSGLWRLSWARRHVSSS